MFYVCIYPRNHGVFVTVINSICLFIILSNWWLPFIASYLLILQKASLIKTSYNGILIFFPFSVLRRQVICKCYNLPSLFWLYTSFLFPVLLQNDCN